jgi:hypothetical protein
MKMKELIVHMRHDLISCGQVEKIKEAWLGYE